MFNTKFKTGQLKRVLGCIACCSALATTAATPANADNGTENSEEISASISLVARSLVVNRYTSASLSNGAADSIFQSASQVLQVNDGAGDVACDLTLQRSGGVRTFSAGDGSIDSSSEFSTVLNVPGFVKVVNTINWCGVLAPNIVGCAPVPGSDLVVVRIPSLEGILWAHEYGHTRRLLHRSSSTAVMNGVLGASHRRVNSSECSNFLN